MVLDLSIECTAEDRDPMRNVEVVGGFDLQVGGGRAVLCAPLDQRMHDVACEAVPARPRRGAHEVDADKLVCKDAEANGGDPASRRAELIDEYTERFANPYIAAERGYVDDVIEPEETRGWLIRALEASLTKREPRPPRKHGNIPL